MAKINLDTNKLTREERDLRVQFTNLKPTIDIPGGVLPVYCTDKIKFNLKETKWDARGVIDGFFAEEDMRKQFFYPYLPCNFMDVGVAHGSWSLPALAAGCSVLGFEIDPRYHETFKECINVNPDFPHRMKLLSLGLYNGYGLGNLFEVEDIIFTPLDMVMPYIGFAPQYIKIDVEGLELLVLDGSRKTLDLLRPKVFIEVHYLKDDKEEDKARTDKGIIDFMKEYSYIYEKGRGEEAFTYFFFYNKEES